MQAVRAELNKEDISRASRRKEEGRVCSDEGDAETGGAVHRERERRSRRGRDIADGENGSAANGK